MSYNSSTGTTKNYFDGFGDVTMSVNADNQTSLSYYDDDGDLTAYVDPSHTTTSYKYDSAGQPTETINPLGTTFTSYDDNGNVTQLVDADGRTTAMSYDSDDRLLSNADGSFAYNADGEMTSASNASGTYLMQYDPEGQVTSVSEPFGVSLNFAYDSQGNRTLMTDSLGGTQLSVYDLDNRLTTLTYSGQSQSLSETLTYYPGGEVSTAALYSGANLIATENYGIGGNDQVTSLVDHFASGTTLAVYDYAYNSLNDLTQTIQNGTTTAYSYDAAGELTGAGTASYAYDANGNPTNLANTDVTGSDNELTQFVDPNTGDTWTYAYDNVGNRTQAIDAGASLTTTWNYAYDNANHMTSATETIGGTAVQTSAYQYDAFGKLIQETITKTGSTAILRYAIDAWNPANAGATGVAGDTDWATLDGTNSNALITRQLMSVGTQAGMQTTPLARIDESGAQDGGGVFYTLTDRMGSVSEVLNNTPNAAPVDQVEYDAYGNMMQTGSMYLGAYSWDGYDYDTATAMNNNNARVYDPVSQRWLSQDPMGYAAGDNNLYRYVNNAPTGGTDPSGFQGQQRPSFGWLRIKDLIKDGVDAARANGMGEADYEKQLGWSLAELRKEGDSYYVATAGADVKKGDITYRHYFWMIGNRVSWPGYTGTLVQKVTIKNELIGKEDSVLETWYDTLAEGFRVSKGVSSVVDRHTHDLFVPILPGAVELKQTISLEFGPGNYDKKVLKDGENYSLFEENKGKKEATWNLPVNFTGPNIPDFKGNTANLTFFLYLQISTKGIRVAESRMNEMHAPPRD